MFHIKQDFLKNEEIRFPVVQVVDEDGTKLENMSSRDAMNLAYSKGLDLVLVSPNTNPPVCKILNYSKYKFEMIKKAKEAKKNQKVVEIKEIRLSPNIDLHDLEVKAKNAIKFLAEGDKVKVAMRFRGRELNFVNQGKEIMNKFVSIIENGQVEKDSKLEGKNLILFLAPKQK